MDGLTARERTVEAVLVGLFTSARRRRVELVGGPFDGLRGWVDYPAGWVELGEPAVRYISEGPAAGIGGRERFGYVPADGNGRRASAAGPAPSPR